MALSKTLLGKIVLPYLKRCDNPNLTPDEVSGINQYKEFFEPSHQVGENTSKYQEVPPLYFACNLMHVGRDEVLPIAFNHSEKVKYVSPAYTVFTLKSDIELLKEYFFIFLKSDEIDRFFWFHTDASVRDGMSWADFCSIEIDLPPLPIQQKYVDIYKAMQQNQRCYERGLDDLKLTFETLLDSYKHSSDKATVGSLLLEIDERNSDGVHTNVQGINITKQFMDSIADTSNSDLRKYKIVKKGQFLYSGMQTGRDECIRISLCSSDNPIVVSPAYSVFIPASTEVVPEYIMMWFSRDESDRLGWFMSDSSIRSNLDLSRFYEIEIPLPDKTLQNLIVKIYKAYVLRKNINEKLKSQIKDICPILIKGSVEEAKKH